MQVHQLTRSPHSRIPKRIGRGGKRGTYSGRGIKGLGARAGGKFRPQERDIIKKIPKLRGYRFKVFRLRPAVVNLDTIGRAFREGETVSPRSLFERGLIRNQGGKLPEVKILGRGELKRNLIFKGVSFSRGADLNRKPGVTKHESGITERTASVKS